MRRRSNPLTLILFACVATAQHFDAMHRNSMRRFDSKITKETRSREFFVDHGNFFGGRGNFLGPSPSPMIANRASVSRAYALTRQNGEGQNDKKGNAGRRDNSSRWLIRTAKNTAKNTAMALQHCAGGDPRVLA
jgi:hypothetical protein